MMVVIIYLNLESWLCMNTSNLFRKKSKSGHSWQGLLCQTAKSRLRCSHISQLQISDICGGKDLDKLTPKKHVNPDKKAYAWTLDYRWKSFIDDWWSRTLSWSALNLKPCVGDRKSYQVWRAGTRGCGAGLVFGDLDGLVQLPSYQVWLVLHRPGLVALYSSAGTEQQLNSNSEEDKVLSRNKVPRSSKATLNVLKT